MRLLVLTFLVFCMISFSEEVDNASSPSLSRGRVSSSPSVDSPLFTYVNPDDLGALEELVELAGGNGVSSTPKPAQGTMDAKAYSRLLEERESGDASGSLYYFVYMLDYKVTDLSTRCFWLAIWLVLLLPIWICKRRQ